jgi:RHS repeat-associated protein
MQRRARRGGELIIRFREGYSERDKNTLVGTRGARRKKILRGRSRIEKLELAAGQEPEAVAESLRYLPAVEFAEPNYLISRDEIIPNDARFIEQWSLKNTGQSGGLVNADIKASAAWETTTGAQSTVIAIIDSGIDFTHPDLINNQWTNSLERNDGLDEDGNGLIDDLHGWDWVSDSNSIHDQQGHGTIVAGIIAAEGNNQTGVSGVMWRASLMSLRVLDNTGTGDVAEAVEAIDYATAHGAQVINCSWGTDEMSIALRDAIERAGRAGVVVVCSAGNAGRDLEVTPYYPASFGLTNVIAVAATDNADALASWSNYGATHVTVAAPGTEILTTRMNGGYRTVSGTSASTPLVTGVAGLIKTQRWWLSAAGTVAAINDGARRLPALAGRLSSGGIVDAAGALAAMQGPNSPPPGSGGNGGPPPPPPPSGSGNGGINTAPPPVTQGAPGPDLPNLDARRGQQPAAPKAPAPIQADTLPICDANCGGAIPSGSDGSDPDTATARTQPENQTGEPGVDLGSRNFNWTLPLKKLKGRAGLDLMLSLSYNSLVWTRDGDIIKFNADRGFPGPGFRLGFPTLQRLYFDANEGTQNFLMITPSGGRMELRRVGTSSVYESTDGTYTQLVFGGTTAIVRTSDGTQYTFVPWPSAFGEYRCTQVKDRNGNYLSATYNTYGRPQTMTDTLGRVLTFNYNAGTKYLENISQQQLINGVLQQHPLISFSIGELQIQAGFADSLQRVGPSNNATIGVLTQVGLDDGTSYRFSYTSWGQVYRINHHAQDTHLLSYTSYNLDTTPGQTDCPRFTERRDWAQEWNLQNGGATEAVTRYSYDPGGAWAKVIGPDGVTHIETFYTASGWQKGLPTGAEEWTADPSAGGVKKKWSSLSWTQDNINASYPINPRPQAINTYDSNNNKSRTRYVYTAQFGLPSDVYEYASDTDTNLLRRTHTDYVFAPEFIDRRLIGFVSGKYLYDAGDNLQAKSLYWYDWASHLEATSTQALPQHDTANYGTTFTLGRGNLVCATRFDVNDPNNAYNTIVENKWAYNTTGSVTLMRDQLWHQTTISYADSFADGTNRNSFAYPTQVTDADSNQSFFQYDFYLGAATRIQSPSPNAGQSAPYQTLLYDVAGRLERLTSSVNGAFKRWVYWSDNLQVYSFESINAVADEAYSSTFYDGIGNVRATARSHPGSSGGYSAQYTYYDVMNRVVQQSNPTEINPYFQATGDDATGWQWTLQQYDWKGRPTIATLPGGATIENSYDGCGCAGGAVTTTRDERGRRKRMTADALGRLKQVEELNWDQSVYATSSYTYDVQDQLTRIDQQGSVRTFDYDGHGRLWKRTTPEQGQTEYAYNTDDTLQWLKDARGAKTTFGYNGRHLLTSVSYDLSGVSGSGSVAPTPNVIYAYDAAGNRRQMTDGLGTATYEYDQLSRLTAETRRFNDTLPQSPLANNSYRFSYTFNLADELASATNPFGSQVNYAYDSSGGVTGATGSGFLSAPSYVSNILYRAWGAAKQVAYGNSRTLTASYDNRRRLTRWDVAGVFGYQYSYNFFNENSGRVTFASQLYDHTLDRSFDYDQVGRLLASYSGKEARWHTGQEAYSGADGPYAESYVFDKWGNVTGRNGWGAVNAQYSSAPQFVANKLTVNPLTGAVVQHDAAGNLLTDGAQTFTYDASGQQTSATGTGLQQSYDGDGLRARKTENGLTTYYLRSTILGQQVAVEASGSGAFKRGYVYLGGQLLALQENNQVTWVHQDPVTKSQRLTNSAGSVVSWVELDPWGAETNRSNNSQQQPHRFTSYERDANGGDEAMMRRYEGKWQRFAQPDPYDGSYDLSEPQSLNRYTYVLNDPINFVDPSGLDGGDLNVICLWGICFSAGGPSVTISAGGADIIGGGSASSGMLLKLGVDAEGDEDGFGDNAGQRGNCGVNPVTGQPGFSEEPRGVPGHLRPGVGGGGRFHDRRGVKPGGHSGLDISGVNGQSAVYANRGGMAMVSSGPKGGNAVYIDHGDGVTTSYFHLSSITIKAGPVSQGQQIGVVGQTGNAAGQPHSEDHVHFSATVNGGLVNPATYLNSPCPQSNPSSRRRRR